MATVRSNVTVAIASASANVLNDTAFQFIEGPAIVSVWASSQDYTDVTMDFKVGSIEIVSGGVPNTEAAAGTVNRQTDLMVDRQYIPRGRHLTRLIFHNADGAATRRANYLVQVDQP